MQGKVKNEGWQEEDLSNGFRVSRLNKKQSMTYVCALVVNVFLNFGIYLIPSFECIVFTYCSTTMKKTLKFNTNSLGAQAVGTFQSTLTWPSMQGGQLWPGMASVSSESIVIVQAETGALDARMFVEFMNSAEFATAFDIVQLDGTTATIVGTVSLGVTSNTSCVCIAKLASTSPGVYNQSPFIDEFSVKIEADNTISKDSNVVNGYYYGGIPQSLTFPIVTAVQSTSTKPSIIYGPAREAIRIRSGADVGLSTRVMTFNMSEFVPKNQLFPVILTNSQFSLLAAGTGLFADIGDPHHGVGVKGQYLPPLTEIPWIDCNNNYEATHFCLKMSNTGGEIVGVANRIPGSGMMPASERDLVWIATVVYTRGRYILPCSYPNFCFRTTPNLKVVVFENLAGNTIYLNGHGSGIVPPNQEALAYTNDAILVQEPGEIVEEVNEEVGGKRKRIEFV